MKVELFGWTATFYKIEDTWYVDFPKLSMLDSTVLSRYTMFLSLVEWHMRELNNG